MIRVNLIPESAQLKQAQVRHMKRWTIAILSALAILSAPLGIDWYETARAADMRTRNDQLQVRLAGARQELKLETAQAEQALLRLERANALRSKRAWSAMIAMIARRLPKQCWLTSIATDPVVPQHTTTPTARGRGPTTQQKDQPVVIIDAPRMLRIAGYATNPGEPHEFIIALKDSRVFKSVVLERSQREPALDGYYFHFNLRCEW